MVRGGDVDVISQWTYSYPDPLRINVATDELFAMAKGAGREARCHEDDANKSGIEVKPLPLERRRNLPLNTSISLGTRTTRCSLHYHSTRCN